MNFFSHCLVASQCSDDPAVWLGAMLPDFFGMAKIPRPEVRNTALKEGVKLHHLTDKVFHQDRAFLAMLSEGAVKLRELGVRRGPARALSHVAIELHLDGLLSRDDNGVGAMKKAMAVPLAGALSFREPEQEASLLRLVDRVASQMHPTQYQDAEIVHQRLVRIMSRRPRLTLNLKEEQACQQVSGHLRALVQAQGHDLAQRIFQELGIESGPRPTQVDPEP